MKENTSLSTFKESLKVNDLIWLVLQQAGERFLSRQGGKSKNVVVLKNTYKHRKSCLRIRRQDSDKNRRNQRRNSKKSNAFKKVRVPVVKT